MNQSINKIYAQNASVLTNPICDKIINKVIQ